MTSRAARTDGGALIWSDAGGAAALAHRLAAGAPTCAPAGSRSSRTRRIRDERVDLLAQCAPGHAGRRRAVGLRSPTARCWSTASTLRWVGPDGAWPRDVRSRRRTRPRRRAGHAGPDRLPHPPGLRRPARARVRAAAARRELRRHRARRRRHPLHRGRHARRQRRRAVRRRAAQRALALMAEGVTTIEIKSGYGLDRDDEARCLRVARRLGARAAADGAHHLPRRARAAAGVRRPRRRLHRRRLQLAAALHAEGLVDAVDAFCERIGFTLAQTQRVFEAARALGLPVKLHAEQLSDMRGAALAARVRRAVVRPPRAPERGRRAAMARGRHGRRAAARRVLLPARDQAAADRARCARPACRWRSRPTTTPARRRRCRCC